MCNAHKKIILLGDFNAQIGGRRQGEESVLGSFCYGKRTRNGEKLLELAYENNFKVLNTLFKSRKNNRWTWSSPGDLYRNEIDYILTNANTSFQDSRVIKNINFNSNHRMVRAKLIPEHSKKTRPFKINPVRTNQVIFTEEFNSKLENFTEEMKKVGIQNKYDALVDIITSSTKVKETSRNSKLSENTKTLLQKRANLLTDVKTKLARPEISSISKLIKESLRQDRKIHRLRTFETQIAKTGGIKKAIRNLTEKREWIPKIKNNRGKHMTRRPDILASATEFYRNLYSKVRYWQL